MASFAGRSEPLTRRNDPTLGKGGRRATASLPPVKPPFCPLYSPQDGRRPGGFVCFVSVVLSLPFLSGSGSRRVFVF